MCGFTQSSSDDFDWTRQSMGTSSQNTGPNFDHTYGTAKGFYVYAEASSPRKQGDKAQLVSNQYPATTASCVRFFYTMNGQGLW